MLRKAVLQTFGSVKPSQSLLRLTKRSVVTHEHKGYVVSLDSEEHLGARESRRYCGAP